MFQNFDVHKFVKRLCTTFNTIQNFDVHKFVKRLCTTFKNFYVKNVCIMISGCIFKNGAPMQVLRKVRILTKFGLCYTMREKVKIRKMQISFILFSFWPSYATFSMRRFFIDLSI